MGFKKTGCSEIQCMTQNNLKLQIFALLKKFWSTLRYFNESIEYIWIRGQEKEIVVWIVRSQSNISVNHQWIKKITYKKKKHQLWRLRWWWIIISKDTLRVVFTQGFSSQIWILIKCNVISKMCSKQKSINEMNYYRQNTWHFYFIMELG